MPAVAVVVGLGLAAAEITPFVVGSALLGGSAAVAAIEGGTLIASTLGGVVIGAGTGALSAAVQGGDIGKGALMGAVSGGIGSAIGPSINELVSDSMGIGGNLGKGIASALTGEIAGTAAGVAGGMDIGQAAKGSLLGALQSGLYVGSGMSDLMNKAIGSAVSKIGDSVAGYSPPTENTVEGWSDSIWDAANKNQLAEWLHDYSGNPNAQQLISGSKQVVVGFEDTGGATDADGNVIQGKPIVESTGEPLIDMRALMETNAEVGAKIDEAIQAKLSDPNTTAEERAAILKDAQTRAEIQNKVLGAVSDQTASVKAALPDTFDPAANKWQNLSVDANRNIVDPMGNISIPFGDNEAVGQTPDKVVEQAPKVESVTPANVDLPVPKSSGMADLLDGARIAASRGLLSAYVEANPSMRSTAFDSVFPELRAADDAAKASFTSGATLGGSKDISQVSTDLSQTQTAQSNVDNIISELGADKIALVDKSTGQPITSGGTPDISVIGSAQAGELKGLTYEQGAKIGLTTDKNYARLLPNGARQLLFDNGMPVIQDNGFPQLVLGKWNELPGSSLDINLPGTQTSGTGAKVTTSEGAGQDVVAGNEGQDSVSGGGGQNVVTGSVAQGAVAGKDGQDTQEGGSVIIPNSGAAGSLTGSVTIPGTSLSGSNVTGTTSSGGVVTGVVSGTNVTGTTSNGATVVGTVNPDGTITGTTSSGETFTGTTSSGGNVVGGGPGGGGPVSGQDSVVGGGGLVSGQDSVVGGGNTVTGQDSLIGGGDYVYNPIDAGADKTDRTTPALESKGRIEPLLEERILPRLGDTVIDQGEDKSPKETPALEPKERIEPLVQPPLPPVTPPLPPVIPPVPPVEPPVPPVEPPQPPEPIDIWRRRYLGAPVDPLTYGFGGARNFFEAYKEPAAAQGGYFDADQYFADGGLVTPQNPPSMPTMSAFPTMAFTDGQGPVGSIAQPPGLLPGDSVGSDAPHASPMAPSPAAASPGISVLQQVLGSRNTNASPALSPVSQNPNVGYALGKSPLSRL